MRLALPLTCVLVLLTVIVGPNNAPGAAGIAGAAQPAPATYRLVVPALRCSGCRVEPGAASAAALETCIAPPLPAGLPVAPLPPDELSPENASRVAAAIFRYEKLGLRFESGLRPYDPVGEYLNFASHDVFETDGAFGWDAAGIPLVDYDGVLFRNPVTVAQYALTLHGRYLRGTAEASEFLHVVEVLLGMQAGDGGFPAGYAFRYYLTGEVLQPGWGSAMSQGQALSVFRRAYDVRPDPRYLVAGDRAIEYLRTARADGGPMDTLAGLDPALDRLITFEEFPTREPYYTLNGFLFTLLGLYDWSTLERDDGAPTDRLARELFECGLATAVYSLPYYDVGGFSTYDLGHVLTGGPANIQAEYHAIHLQLLFALNTVHPQPELAHWYRRWRDVLLAGPPG